MIESRYKIEYVLPDEKVKKASSFRILWYLLLIPLILLAVTAITYDFSIQNIQKDSLVLIEKAKIHVFNLNNNQQLKTPEKTKEIVKTKSITPSLQKQSTPKAPPLQATTENTDHKIITKLTNQQQLQLKTIKEQIEKNSQLSKDLNKLSSELVLEKTKNESLNNKLSEQEKDSLELAKQLNTILSKSANNEVILENFTPVASDISSLTDSTIQEKAAEKQPKENKTLISKDTGIINTEEKTQASETDKIIEAMSVATPIASKISETKNVLEEVKPDALTTQTIETNPSIDNKIDKVIAENKESENNKDESPEETNISSEIVNKETSPAIQNQESNLVEVISQSETDKIIEAMSSIKSDTNIKEITETNTTLENGAPEPINPSSQKTAEENIQAPVKITDKAISEITVEKTEVSLPVMDTITIVDNIEPAEKDLLVKNTEEKPELKQEIAEDINTLKPDAALDVGTIENPEDTSAVDDIIAAMEQAQSNNTSSSNIDPELEKDIKNQLVEQGELSIDN